MPRLARITIVALLLAPVAAASQEPAQPPASQLRVDATSLRSARYNYELAIVRDSARQPLGTQTISFTPATHAGSPSWLILESRVGSGTSTLDSLVASRDALLPLHWGTSTGLARLAAAFSRDSVYGATSSPLGKRSLIGPAPRGVITSEGTLDAVLQLAPLDAGWWGDVTLLVVDLAEARLVAARLAVEREEEVTVPAGAFPAWVVSLRTGNAEKWFWVSKTDRVVVRTRQTLPQLEGAVLDRVLTRVDDLRLIPAPAVPLPGDAPAAPRPRSSGI